MAASSTRPFKAAALFLLRRCSPASRILSPSLSTASHAGAPFSPFASSSFGNSAIAAPAPVHGELGGGMQLLPSLLTSVRHYAKRAKKWQGAPYAWLPIPPEGEQVPPSRPNKGSVKNRNHQKRMAQRAEFAKLQAHTRREQQKVANINRDSARRKRWKEGAERAKAWAQLQADRAAEKVLVPV